MLASTLADGCRLLPSEDLVTKVRDEGEGESSVKGIHFSVTMLLKIMLHRWKC